MSAGAGLEKHLLNGQHLETVACLKGIEHAASLGIQHIIVVTDALSVARAIGDLGTDRPPPPP